MPRANDNALEIASKLISGFAWDDTKQGDIYWRNVHSDLLDIYENGLPGRPSAPNTKKQESSSGASLLTTSELMKRVEQLALDVKATLEAEESLPQPSRKAIARWRHALSWLQGAEHKRGMVEDLKDWFGV